MSGRRRLPRDYFVDTAVNAAIRAFSCHTVSLAVTFNLSLSRRLLASILHVNDSNRPFAEDILWAFLTLRHWQALKCRAFS